MTRYPQLVTELSFPTLYHPHPCPLPVCSPHSASSPFSSASLPCPTILHFHQPPGWVASSGPVGHPNYSTLCLYAPCITDTVFQPHANILRRKILRAALGPSVCFGVHQQSCLHSLENTPGALRQEVGLVCICVFLYLLKCSVSID